MGKNSGPKASWGPPNPAQEVINRNPMFGGDGSATLDFKGAAEATAAGNQAATAAQTQANRPNQSTPWANSQWTKDANGNWTQSVGFNGGLDDYSNALVAQLRGQKPLDFSGLPALTDGAAARDQAISSAYGQATSRLDPQWAQREQSLRASLANQGLDPNSEAGSAELSQFGRDRNDAYSSAMNGAIGQGTVAGNALFQQSLAGRQQAMAEALRQHGQPLADLQGLQGLLTMPGFTAAGNAGGVNYLGAMQGLAGYNAQQAAAQNQIWGDIIGGGALLGGAAIMSDERLKTNIVRGEREVIPGVPEASWEWKDAPGPRHTGVIAQDVERVRPDLVVTLPSGFKAVRYGALLSEASHG